MTSCIACGYHHTYPIYQPSNQPMAALALPEERIDAQTIQKYPMNFHACANCGHIFNVDFEYAKVPYKSNSNLMYNKGSGWVKHMEQLINTLQKSYDFSHKKMIDIGCGDGMFFKLFMDSGVDSQFIGYEPGIESENAAKHGLKMFQDYFLPERDLPKHQPDYLFCRHVIEHLESPKDFVANIAYWANHYCIYPTFVAEVPCIENAIRDSRINDYLYEHVSNFTEFSFRHMFEQSGYQVLDCFKSYHDEVLVIVAKPKKIERLQQIKAISEHYRDSIKPQYANVHSKLQELKNQGKKIAFWGGTGKGASFLNAFELSFEEYPIVIDSDYHKVGKFVPSMAQEILPPEYLMENPAEIIVVTTQWRVADIAHEIKERGIKHEQILYLVDNELRIYE